MEPGNGNLEKIKQNHDLLMKLPINPKSLDLAAKYVNQSLINFNFEVMKTEVQIEVLKLLSSMLERYRKIRAS